MAIDYIVRFSDEFLEQASMAALEAYCFGDGPKGRRRLESYGLIWGSRRKTHGPEIIHLDRLFISLSAKRERDSVAHKKRAINQMMDLVSRLAPHRQFLGFYHSHPYRSLHQVQKTVGGPGYEFSDDDFAFLKGQRDFWDWADQSPVMAVSTICPMARVREGDEAPDQNVWRYNIGQFRFWLNVAVGYMDGGTPMVTGNKRSSVALSNGPLLYNVAGDRISA